MAASTDANFSDNFSQLSYTKPKKRCPLWFYNPRAKTFLGRTAGSWFKIFIFYVIYYALLAGFFVGMIAVFLNCIITEKKPRLTGDHSLLKLSPGIGYLPSKSLRNSLIRYSIRDPQTYKTYVASIDAYLNQYYDLNGKSGDNIAKCANGTKTPQDVDKICKFDLAKLGPCNKDSSYGYKSGSPCIITKLNKIYGWLPDIPSDSAVQHPLIECTHQNPLDADNIGKIRYYPETTLNGKKYGMFDSSYFPYVGQKSYVGPLVAIQFESIKTHTTVLVKCQLLNVDLQFQNDPMKFEIMVDK